MGTKKGRKHFGKTIIDEVLRLRDEGKSHREISEYFGLESKDVIKKLLERHRKKERLIEAGLIPRKKGRPRKHEIQGEKFKDNKIKQLQMQNQLLRSFLSEAGRMWKLA